MQRDKGYLNEELMEVKRLRKMHNLTQTQLAKLAGVSQSLIAKIEAGSIDPTFSHAKKIFEVLHNIQKESEPKAGELITDRIVSVRKHDSVIDAAKKMKEHGISQLPVIADSTVVGLISETGIIENLTQGKSLSNTRAWEVMEEPPPSISKNTPLTAVTELLRHAPLVIVTENGKPKGVITKADILRKIM